MPAAPDDLYSLLGGAASGIEAPIGDRRIPERMTGTTIMAVEFDGGVVVAADSRTSTGSYIANRTSDKLTPVAERIYTCRSGSAADTQAISDYVRLYLSHYTSDTGKEPSVKVAAHLFKSLCYNNKDRLTAGIICGGWDEAEGGQVYSIAPYSGAMVREPMSISGSGSSYVYGYIDANFREGMSKEECEEFCKQTVSLAMARDGSSGGVIRMATITKEGVNRVYISNHDIPRHYQG